MAEDLPGFQVFQRTRRGGRRAGAATLTVVAGRGDILLTKRARALLAADLTHVALASEGHPASRIALVPATTDTPRAQQYRLTPNGTSGARVGARAFVHALEVPAGRFDVVVEDGMLVAVVR